MKRFLWILVLGLVISFNAEADSYVFEDNLYTDGDIITKKDPTTFQNLVFIEEKNIKFWDRRKATTSGWDESNFKVFIFKATFEKGHDVAIRVNAEFKTKDKAEKQALKYGTIVGQLPNFLRENLKTVTIHKGNEATGGGNNDILIHTGDSAVKGEFAKFVEEVMLHELGHVSLDWDWGGSVDASKWKAAQKADNKFISKYAKEFPDGEDVAETILWWVAVKCKPDRISKSNYKKVLKAIPNRLKYLDEQNYDVYPLVCK